VVCPFTPQLLLVLSNRPQSDGMVSWHWYTVAVGEIQSRDLTIGGPAYYQMATSASKTRVTDNIWPITGTMFKVFLRNFTSFVY